MPFTLRCSLLCAALVLTASCGNGTLANHPCTTSGDCPHGNVCVDSRCVSHGDGGAATDAGSPTEILSVRVEPPDATLESVDGSMPTQLLTLIGMQRDGMEVPLSGARWTSGTMLVGAVDGSGLFTATGMAGGVVVVTGISPTGLSAMASITVNLHRTVLAMGVDATGAAHFGGTGTMDATSIDVLYPLEGAVMPANVYPPVVQWAPVGNPGDFYRVHVTEPHVELSGILVWDGTFGSGWAIPRDVWRPLADSASDAPISITVDRFDVASSTLVAGHGARTMRLAHGNVFGNVYYENRAGRANILRIQTETATLTDLIPNPYPNSGGTRCVGCHALTHDGRYAFATNAETEAVYDLTVDLTTDPPATRYPIMGGPSQASFDSMGTYFVGGSHVAGALNIYDATTGATVPSTGLPTTAAGYCSWSPDGMHIAYAGDVVTDPPGSAEPGDPVGGNIWIAERTSATGLDFTTHVLHMGSALSGNPEGGVNDTHPTWSPDSHWIAFQHGTGTFTHVVRNPGALYLLGLDGTVVPLGHASGVTTPTDGYWPTFAPYVTEEMGGRHYYWMAFYTRRDYGNGILGTQAAQRRQLWVAAIDSEPTPGTDPSFVPYWLPGQDTQTSNFSAFWAPEACRMTGTSCSTASECCSGRCEAGATGEFACTPPPASECHYLGEGCGGDGECCSGLVCTGNVCTETIH